MTDIGPDPSKWINRLMDVAEESQFTKEQKVIIAAGLMRILVELEKSNKPKGQLAEPMQLGGIK